MGYRRVEFADVKVGDELSFSCNGKGRGGHCRVTVTVDKINRKTLTATETDRSYRPGTIWQVHADTSMVKFTR